MPGPLNNPPPDQQGVTQGPNGPRYPVAHPAPPPGLAGYGNTDGPPAPASIAKYGAPPGPPPGPPLPAGTVLQQPPPPAVRAYLTTLTPSERLQYQQQAALREKAVVQALERQQQLKQFADLAHQGTQAVRLQQSRLHQVGYNIAVDGQFGPQTQQALQSYLKNESAKALASVQQANDTSNPLTIRAQSNQRLEPQAPDARQEVTDYATSTAQQLKAALNQLATTSQAPSSLNGGKASPAYQQTLDLYNNWQRLATDAADPNKYDNVTILQIQRNIRQGELAAEQQNRQNTPSGLKGALASGVALAETVLQPVLKVVTPLYTWLATGFDASLIDQEHGGSILQQLQAGFASLLGPVRVPGTEVGLGHLIAPGGSGARAAVDATNTPEERAALYASGDLLSPGQAITGSVTKQFREKHPELVGPDFAHPFGYRTAGAHDVVSGLADFALVAATDPVKIGFEGLEPLTEVGRFAADTALRTASPELVDAVGADAVRQAGRRVFLDQSTTGRLLQLAVGDTLDNGIRSASAETLRKSLPGLDAATAEKAIATRAATEGGLDAANQAAKQVIIDAFVEGKYNPTVGAVRQLLNYGRDKLGLLSDLEEGTGKAFSLLGRKTVALTDRLAWVRSLAAPLGPTATTFESNATAFVDSAIDGAAKVGGTTWRSLWADKVAPVVEHLPLSDRFYSVVDQVNELNDPSLRMAMEGTFRKFFTDGTLLKSYPLTTYMEAAFQQEGFADAVRKMEVATYLLGDAAPEAARRQFQIDLARGFLVGRYDARNVVANAARDLNIRLGAPVRDADLNSVRGAIDKLPDTGGLRQHFLDRLEGLSGKPAGLPTLQRDVELVLDNRSLRNEVVRQLDTLEERTAKFAEGAHQATKPGLGRVLRGPAKALLSNVNVVAPPEIRFKYETQNEAFHASLRARDADRFMNAFFASPEATQQMIAAVESVKTEQQFLDVTKRMVRAALEVKGVDNPDQVLEIIAEQGHFASLRDPVAVIRSVDEAGDPVTNLQTLAQRIESAPLPRPDAVAQAVRKAILDGTQDANLARQLATRLQYTVDKIGGIEFNIVRSDGTKLTLKGGAYAFHRLWKFLVVSNAGLPILGAAAGFIGTHGSITDRLRGAGLGFAVGSLGMLRYISRVAGTEDRNRIWLDGTLTADNSIPGWASATSRRPGEDPFRRTLSDDLVRIGANGSTHFENDFLVHVDPDWTIISRDDSRATDAWYRILNHQIHPESDPVTAILLREQAGHLGGEEEIWVENAGKVAKTGKPIATFDKPTQALVDALYADTAEAVGASNEQLLQDFPRAPTRLYFAGAPGGGEVAPDALWLDSEDAARSVAGATGDVWSVSLPTTNAGEPLVGTQVNGGLRLSGDDLPWNHASDAVVPDIPRTFHRETILTTAREAADQQIADFLKTDEGKLWADRWKGALNGAKSPTQAVETMRSFIERYTTPDLAAMRVAGGEEGHAAIVDRSILERALKEGAGPDEFHAQASWRMPKGPSDLFRSAKDVVGRGQLSGPSNYLNRGPLQNSLFLREYDRLTLEGVARSEAQQIADQYATEHVNSLLHRFDEPSIAAQKLDLFAPFQHAREDIFRVYGRLIVENPRQVFRTAVYVARAFNDGRENGMFTYNQFTHKWEITVPQVGGRFGADIFGFPSGVQFNASLNDVFFLFGSSGTEVFGAPAPLGFLYQPGGLYWASFSKALATAHPEVFEGNFPLHQWLFPYGPTGEVLPKSYSRMWMAFTGDVTPWSSLDVGQQQNDVNRWRVEVAQQLIYAHLKANPKDTHWLPTDADVDEATKNFFKAWSFYSSFFPAASTPTLTSSAKYDAARNTFTLGGIIPFDENAFLKQYPYFEPFVIGATTKYVGPDDLSTLNKLRVGQVPDSLSRYDEKTGQWVTLPGSVQGENYTTEDQLGFRRPISWSEYKAMFKDFNRTNDYYAALDNARKIPGTIERERALSGVAKKYPDIVGKLRKDYDVTQAVNDVYTTYPKQLQNQAYQRIATQYGMTNAQLTKYIAKVSKPGFIFQPNPWVDARQGFEVDASVSQAIGPNASALQVQRYVATLPPAEQARYWEYKMDSLGFDATLGGKEGDDPVAVVNRYRYDQQQYYGVVDAYPALYRNPTFTPAKAGSSQQWVNPFTKLVTAEKADIANETSATYTTIDHLQSEMDQAAQSKSWSVYYALKAKRDQLYDYADALHNQLLNKIPDLTKYYEDLHAATVYGALGNAPLAAKARAQAAIDRHPGTFVQISEQTEYLNMPTPVKRAYVKDLVDRLDMPAGKIPYDISQYVKNTTGLSKLFWEYLTPTQQAILSANYPSRVEDWKYQSNYYLHGPGATSSGSSSGSGGVPSDLAYAYALLDKANKRGNMKAPAAYADYLALPNNATVKADFLDKHPDVKAYLDAGPFANLSPTDKAFVTNTMVKYGKWQSGTAPTARGSGSAREVSTDLAWAREQLYIWSRRGDRTKPPTYDLWLNMPSGEAKAQYLQQHPEIGEWIRLGPMANMPEEFQQVVRDIMVRYGEWTQTQDPLGQTITQFYSLPDYARDGFLLNHPELEAYWAQTRTPQEQAMFDLESTYFKLQDLNARKAFLAAHPELQQHFVDARTQRYEQFLNQVAVYMGANPELFTEYLQRQTDILAELLRKFAQPNLVRERSVAEVAAANEAGDRHREVRRAA